MSSRSTSSRKNYPREFYEKISDKLTHGWIIFQSNKILDISDKLMELLGYSEEDVIGMSPLEFVHDSSLDHVSKRWDLESDQTYFLNVKTKSSQVRTIAVQPLILDESEDLRIAIVRKVMDNPSLDTITSELDDYQVMVELSPNQVMVVNSDLKIIYVNRSDHFRIQDLINKPIIEIVADESVSQFEKALSKTLYDRLPIQVEITGTKGDIYLTQLIPLSTGSVLIYWVNISDIKSYEEEQIRFQEQILQSQHLESVSVLAAGVAHDYNNLLTGMRGYLDLIRMSTDTDEIKEYANNLEILIHTAADLSRQMLKYTGNEPTVKIINDPLEVLNKTVEMMRNNDIWEVELEVITDDEIPLIAIDRTQFQQVIVNLMHNAVEAMDYQGRLVVKLSVVDAQHLPEKMILDPYRGSDRYLSFSVLDQGGGIAPESYPRIFQPFYTTKMTGKGLGLSVVHGILKAHEGGIEIESELFKGTQITTYWPFDY
ncbi:MAG: ATP-binding protein [Candidatus Kariarchaeaceae archaeon]|jgi:PAS domain S-box-containing protein